MIISLSTACLVAMNQCVSVRDEVEDVERVGCGDESNHETIGVPALICKAAPLNA